MVGKVGVVGQGVTPVIAVKLIVYMVVRVSTVKAGPDQPTAMCEFDVDVGKFCFQLPVLDSESTPNLFQHRVRKTLVLRPSHKFCDRKVQPTPSTGGGKRCSSASKRFRKCHPGR